MAEDPYSVPGAEGVTPAIKLPDAPGDFGETVPNLVTAEPGKKPNPFTPLTPAQELEERRKLNYAQSHLDTVSGASRALLASSLAEAPRRDTRPTTPTAPYSVPGTEGVLPAAALDDIKFSPNGFQDTAKDELESTKAAILAYKNMPGFSNVGEFGAALYGQVGGQILTPENFVNPFFKIGSATWRAAHPLLSTIIGYGTGQAAVQGVADVAAQSEQVKADLRKEWDPIQTSLAIPTGFIFGTLPAFAKDNQILRYKNILQDLTKTRALEPARPQVTPEMTPSVPPIPDKVPGDVFVPGGTPRAIDITSEAPTSSGVLPEPAAGMTRLYRAQGAADGEAQRIAFSLTPFDNANEYMDVPAHIAVSMRQGDRVILPAPSAANRKPLPKPEAPPEAKAVDPYADLAEGTDISGEAARQQGIPFMITKAMKQDLADAGYSAEQIKKMTPQEAHEALLKSDEGDVRAAEIARAGPRDIPVEEIQPHNADEARALEIAKEMEGLGGDAAGFARGLKSAVKSGLLKAEQIPFAEERLAGFRAKAVPGAPKPRDTKTLVDILTDRNQKAFGNLEKWPEEVQTVIKEASAEFSDAVRFINESGFKFDEVNSHTARDQPQVREAKTYTANLGGSVSRLIGSFFERVKRNNKVPGSGDARIKADTEKLRKTIDEGPELPKAPALTVEQTPAGAQTVLPGAERIGVGEQAQRAADQPLRAGAPQKEAGGLFGDESKQLDLMDQPKERPPQTFTQWVRSQGGLKNDAEVESIYGYRKIDLVRKTGNSMDNIREAAVQQGWLPENASIEDVKVLLRDEDKGIKHYHPGEQGRVRAPDAEMIRAQDEVDTALREFNLHPDQAMSAKAKAERRGIRDDAIDDVYRNELEPDTAVERATARLGEHGRAAAGASRFDDRVEIPFDTEPTSRAGRGAGEAAPGLREPSGEPPAAGRGLAPSGEDEVAARLKKMQGQGVSAPPGSQRPAAGIASANVHAPFTPLESIQDAMTRTINNLQLTVRKGAVKGQGAVAQYDYGTAIIRLKDTGPAGVADLAHEMGHDVENTVGRPLKNLIDNNHESMRAFAGDAGDGMDPATIRREGFGEFMAGFVTNRNTVEQIDPVFVRQFVEMMNNENPELLAQLNRLQQAYEKFNAAPSMQSMTAMTKSEFAIPKVIDNDPLQRGPIGRWWDGMYRKIVARDNPMDNAVKLAGRIYNLEYGKLMDLAPFEDPRVWSRIYGRGGFNKTVDDIQYGVMDFETMERMGPGIQQPINEMLADPITKLEPKDPDVVNLRRDQISAYLIARWVHALHTQMERGERAMAIRMPTSATKGDAEVAIREFEQLYPHWRANAELIYGFQKDVVRMEMKTGLRTVDEGNELLHPRNWEYVPLLRDMTGMVNELSGTGAKDVIPGLETLGRHARVGSDRDVKNVLESIFQNVAHANDQAVENMTKLSYRDLMRRLPREAAAAIGEEIPNERIRAMDIDVKDTMFKAAKKAGYTTEDARMFASRALRELGEDEMRVKFYSREPIKTGGRPIIFGWDKGERFAIQLADGDFGRQLVNTMDMLGPKGSQISAQAAGLLVDVMSVGSATLRTGATTTLTYGLKNLVKDSFMQWLLIPEVGTIEGFPLAFRNIRRGATSFFQNDDFYKMHTSTEGIGGGVGTAGLQRGQKGLIEIEKKLKLGGLSPYQAQRARVAAEAERRANLAGELETAGLEQHKGLYFDNFKKVIKVMESTETFGRVGLFRAIYDHNIEMGRSHRYAMFDAAMKARDFVDYGRFGSKMELYARAIPFLNASIQGIDKFHRVVGNILMREAVTIQEQEAKSLARMKLVPRVAMLAAASAALEVWNHDDPVVQRMSVQARSQYWIVRLPFIGSGEYETVNGKKVKVPEGMQGAYLFIPKPWEPGTIFNLAERATQFVQSGDPNAMAKFAKSIFYTYSIPNPFEVPGLKAGAGLLSNYDTYFDKPIIPKSLQGIAPHLQASDYTNKFYSWVARSLNATSSAVGYDLHDVQKLLRENFGIVGAVLAAPWSPMQAQFLMQGVFGDMPRELGGFGNWVKALATGDPAKISDVPGLRAFIRDKMAVGEPMSELYNQIGQNDGRLQIARASFEKKVKDGDIAAATTLFNGYDQSQRDYIRVHNAKAGPLINTLHPLDRSSALASVVRSLKDGLQSEGGMATLTGGPTGPRIKLNPLQVDTLVRVLNEYQATEVRNGLIVQGVPGYKYLPIVNSQPYLKTISEISPEIGRELSARLAQNKVMPIETIQRYWPQAQKLVQAGPGANPAILASQLKVIGVQSSLQGYEGGGRKTGRSAIDSGGQPVKRAKPTPVPLPAEGAMQ